MDSVENLRDDFERLRALQLVSNLVIGCLAKQLRPEALKRVIADFVEQSEDVTVRAMNSSSSEAFFQAVQEKRRQWHGVLCVPLPRGAVPPLD